MHSFVSSLCLGILFLFNTVLGSNSTSQLEYSKLEISALQKFRPMVEDVLIHDYEKTDHWLIRWIRAQNFNLDAAARMLRNAQKWRKDNNIDNIVNETPIDFKKSPYVVEGVDREGRPVLELYMSRLDLRKYVVSGQIDKLVRFWIKVMEVMAVRLREAQIEAVNSSRREPTHFVSILDLQGFNLRQHLCFGCIRVFSEWTILSEKYYPEIIQYNLFINTPRVAAPFVEALKPLFSPATSRSFLTFGQDKKEWKTFLLKIIPEDQLPFQWGGTRKDTSVVPKL